MLLMRAETVLVPRYNWSADGLFAKMLYISAVYKISIRGRPIRLVRADIETDNYISRRLKTDISD